MRLMTHHTTSGTSNFLQNVEVYLPNYLTDMVHVKSRKKIVAENEHL